MFDSIPNTIEVPLTKDQVALIDECDRDLLIYKWCATSSKSRVDGKKYIATRNIHTRKEVKKQTTIIMHRVILERVLGRSLLPTERVDHENTNPLDNRRCNLRLATPSQNGANRGKPISNTSNFKGVTKRKNYDRWHAQIGFKNKRYHLGDYDTPEKAYEAYCKAAIEMYGEFVRLD
jgi:hypothetical protein